MSQQSLFNGNESNRQDTIPESFVIAENPGKEEDAVSQDDAAVNRQDTIPESFVIAENPGKEEDAVSQDDAAVNGNGIPSVSVMAASQKTSQNGNGTATPAAASGSNSRSASRGSTFSQGEKAMDSGDPEGYNEYLLDTPDGEKKDQFQIGVKSFSASDNKKVIDMLKELIEAMMVTQQTQRKGQQDYTKIEMDQNNTITVTYGNTRQGNSIIIYEELQIPDNLDDIEYIDSEIIANYINLKLSHTLFVINPSKKLLTNVQSTLNELVSSSSNPGPVSKDVLNTVASWIQAKYNKQCKSFPTSGNSGDDCKNKVLYWINKYKLGEAVADGSSGPGRILSPSKVTVIMHYIMSRILLSSALQTQTQIKNKAILNSLASKEKVIIYNVKEEYVSNVPSRGTDRDADGAEGDRRRSLSDPSRGGLLIGNKQFGDQTLDRAADLLGAIHGQTPPYSPGIETRARAGQVRSDIQNLRNPTPPPPSSPASLQQQAAEGSRQKTIQQQAPITSHDDAQPPNSSDAEAEEGSSSVQAAEVQSRSSSLSGMQQPALSSARSLSAKGSRNNLPSNQPLVANNQGSSGLRGTGSSKSSAVPDDGQVENKGSMKSAVSRESASAAKKSA